MDSQHISQYFWNIFPLVIPNLTEVSLIIFLLLHKIFLKWQMDESSQVISFPDSCLFPCIQRVLQTSNLCGNWVQQFRSFLLSTRISNQYFLCWTLHILAASNLWKEASFPAQVLLSSFQRVNYEGSMAPIHILKELIHLTAHSTPIKIRNVKEMWDKEWSKLMVILFFPRK